VSIATAPAQNRVCLHGFACLLEILACWTVAMASPPQVEAAQGVRFVSEIVRVDIAPPVMQVTGTYRFVNGAERHRFPILYPFARDPALGAPTDARVKIAIGQGRALLAIAPTLDAEGLRISLPFDVTDSCSLEVRYAQELRERRAVYLLSTTGRWGAPLEHATLEVAWPESLGVPHFSFPFVRSDGFKGTTIYRFEANQFLPTKELVVEW